MERDVKGGRAGSGALAEAMASPRLAMRRLQAKVRKNHLQPSVDLRRGKGGALLMPEGKIARVTRHRAAHGLPAREQLLETRDAARRKRDRARVAPDAPPLLVIESEGDTGRPS